MPLKIKNITMSSESSFMPLSSQLLPPSQCSDFFHHVLLFLFYKFIYRDCILYTLVYEISFTQTSKHHWDVFPIYAFQHKCNLFIFIIE